MKENLIFYKKLKRCGFPIYFFFLISGTFIFSVKLGAIQSQADDLTEKAPVMLAKTWDGKFEVKGWWMSEKFDGVRAYWTGKKLISRSGREFQVPDAFLVNFPAFPLDGELWLGRQGFAEVISIVNSSTEVPGWEKLRYLIFDVPQSEGGMESRLKIARIWFASNNNPFVKVVELERCRDNNHLEMKLKSIESNGGEGIMLRKPESAYQIGRSDDMLKVKSFEDAEATVLAHLAGTGRNAKRMGSMKVRMANGIEFEIGTGFSDQERENPPPIGSIITFKYQGFHKSGIPRFASFLRIYQAL